MAFSKWVYIAITAMFLAGTVTYIGMSQSTAKTIMGKACSYWETKGMSHWCTFEHIKITKCDKQLYLVETNNNQCGDLIISGGGGKVWYSLQAYKRNIDVQNKCGYVYHGGCK